MTVVGIVVLLVFLIASSSWEDPHARIEKEIAALPDFNGTLRADERGFRLAARCRSPSSTPVSVKDRPILTIKMSVSLGTDFDIEIFGQAPQNAPGRTAKNAPVGYAR